MSPARPAPIRGRSPTRRRLALTNGLVVAQGTASLLLLIVAGLGLKSIGGAPMIDSGFRVPNWALFNFSPSLVGHDAARSARFYQVLMDRIRQLPGVEAATAAHFVRLDFSASGGDIIIEGRVTEPGKEKLQTPASVLSIRMMRILLPAGTDQGRSCRDREGD